MATVVMMLSNDFVSDPRVEKEARALIGAGHEVTVLAWDRAQAAEPVETRHGIRIERMGPHAVHGGGINSLPGYRHFWAAASARAAELRPDVVHAHDMDTVPAALAAVHGRPEAKLVLDFHELYRMSKAVPSGAKGLVARPLVDSVEWRGLRRANLVVLAWPGMLDRYRKRFHAEVVVVQNTPDIDSYTVVEHPPGETFKLTYIGQKRYVDPLKRLVDSVKRHESLSALLAGGGVAEQEIAAYAAGVDRITVMGRVLHEEIPRLYRDSDAVYCVYDDQIGNARVHMPVKVLEAMALGLPSIVRAGTWVGEYVTRNDVGIAVELGDNASFDRALLGLAENPERLREMGRKGRAIAEAEMNWAHSSAVLLAAYEQMLGHDG